MRQESGRSMIEMIGVLAIMGVLTAGAYALISTAMSTEKRNRTIEDVGLIATAIKSDFVEDDDYSRIDNSNIFAAISKSNKNPYGGSYEVTVDKTNPRQFVIRINGLSKTVCESLKTKTWIDSVGYNTSNHKEGGATANCMDGNKNVVSITYGD